jgi:hypothetical protein
MSHASAAGRVRAVTRKVGCWPPPEIHTNCGDRNGRYDEAPRTGAPAATQDRDRSRASGCRRDLVEALALGHHDRDLLGGFN